MGRPSLRWCPPTFQGTKPDILVHGLTSLYSQQTLGFEKKLKVTGVSTSKLDNPLQLTSRLNSEQGGYTTDGAMSRLT